MKKNLGFIALLFAIQSCKSQEITDTTLGIDDRVALLKYQIVQDIKKKSLASHKFFPIIDKSDFSKSYEYVEEEDVPITPIMDFDKRKQREKYKLRQLITTSEASLVTPQIKSQKKLKIKVKEIDERSKQQNDGDAPSRGKVNQTKQKHSNNQSALISQILNSKDDAMIRQKIKKHLRNKKKSGSKRLEDNAFYRRTFMVDPKNLQNEAMHCQDLVTPYLTGVKVNMSEWKIITYTDRNVNRLLQLIGEDTEQLTRDEIYSIMYQISNIHIRLFQWDVQSLKLLLNVINKENIKRHSFRTVKQGLKRTFNSWRLDFANTTNLLKQAKLFRPPCVRMSNYEGSTKTSKTIRFTKKVKKRCRDEFEQNEECYD